jgi:hypothetical protein
MTDPTLAALDAVSAVGQQALPAAQPTAQQVGRFEAQLQAGGSYEAPSQSWLVPHSVMSDVGHVARDFRAQFAESFQLEEPQTARTGKSMQSTVESAEKLLDKSTRLSYSAMNFQLLGTAEQVTEGVGKTLIQQQS